MASSDKHHDVLPSEDLDSSSCDEDEDDEEEEEEIDASPSTSSAGNDAVSAAALAAANTVTIALPAIPNGDPSPPPSSILTATAVIAADPSAAVPLGERKPMPMPTDDSRKLFQRLWTDEDEIELLQGFLDYSSQRGNRTTHHGQNDTALFYDQIKSKLQLEFNKNQLVEKLRRLKKKYRNVISKISSGKEFSFKSPHDQATFEISRKIWADIGVGGVDIAADDDDPSPGPPIFAVEIKGEDSAGGFAFERRSTPAMMATPMQSARSRKRSRSKPDLRTEDRRGGFPVENSTPISHNPSGHGGIGHSSSNGDVRGLIEETVRNYVSPLLKELLQGSTTSVPGHFSAARGFGGVASNPLPMGFGVGVPSVNMGMLGELAASAVVAGDERWRKQQILELEVYSKRLELVQDQIRAALDDLRSKGGLWGGN